MEKIKVLLADDHPAFREGLSRLLSEQDDLIIVGEAADGEEAVKLANELKPDVAVVDVAMPKLNGIEATKRIKEVCPNTAVLIVSAYDDEPYVINAIEAGASGYLLKSIRVRELSAAIRAVHRDEMIFDSSAARKVFDSMTVSKDKTSTDEPSSPFKQREFEVLKLAAKGMSNKEIAQELTISIRTVQSHLVNIFTKLNVNSRTEAVLHALREGWIALDDLP
jgi:NarL family two-component system response regulator LiaR